MSILENTFDCYFFCFIIQYEGLTMKKIIALSITTLLFPLFANAAETEFLAGPAGISVRKDFPGCTQINKTTICRSVLVAPYKKQAEEEVIEENQDVSNVKPVIAESNEQYVKPNHITYFAFDSSKVSNNEKKKLKKAPLSDNKEIILKGFSDPFGSESYNKELITQRNEAVKKELIKNGIPEKNIQTVVGGELKNPECDDTTKNTKNIQCFAEQRATHIYQ